MRKIPQDDSNQAELAAKETKKTAEIKRMELETEKELVILQAKLNVYDTTSALTVKSSDAQITSDEDEEIPKSQLENEDANDANEFVEKEQAINNRAETAEKELNLKAFAVQAKGKGFELLQRIDEKNEACNCKAKHVVLQEGRPNLELQ